jgi:hypothetical protein
VILTAAGTATRVLRSATRRSIDPPPQPGVRRRGGLQLLREGDADDWGRQAAGRSLFVSGDFFGTLGVSLIGRLVTPADDVPRVDRMGR